MTPADVAYILYTSGTTSTPKGVQLCHGGLIENMWSIGERQRLTPADRMWMGISLFWSFGCANALLAVMTHGGTIVLQEQLEPGAALALIERERCTVYYGTPNIALALTEHPDRPRRDLSSLRTGAAIGPPPAMQMVMDLGAREICNVYGLTECYGNCSVTDAHDSPEVRRTTVGRPLPGMEIRVVDRRDAPPAAGRRGRRDPRARAPDAGLLPRPRRGTRPPSTREGFLLTGDLGFDRRRRPAPLPRPHQGDGQDGRDQRGPARGGGSAAGPPGRGAGLRGRDPGSRGERRSWSRSSSCRDGHAAEPEALRALCRDALAAYKVPQEFHVMAREDLPVTGTGKVQKFRLAELLGRNAAPRAREAHPADRLAAERRALALTVFISFVGFQFFSPFLPLYIRELGVRIRRRSRCGPACQAAVTPAMSGILSPVFGRLADRFGRKMM